MERNGNVCCRDCNVEPDRLLDSIDDTPLKTLLSSEKQRRFGQNKYDLRLIAELRLPPTATPARGVRRSVVPRETTGEARLVDGK